MSATPSITVRPHPFPDDVELPPHWFDGNVWLTHSANGLHLVFPDGERFFIRSVMRYAKDLDDPGLKARVKAFAGQEAQHGMAHEAAFRAMERQGLEVESWLRWYRHVAYDLMEPSVPPRVRLATTVALEHFTATLAHEALDEDYLSRAHPAMQRLLQWHAAEEIEHKAVAFEVFQAAGGTYPERVAGLAIATGTLMGFWFSATRHVARQDPAATGAAWRKGRRAAAAMGRDGSFLWRAVRSFLRPDFHPDDHDDRHLAADFLAAVGMA